MPRLNRDVNNLLNLEARALILKSEFPILQDGLSYLTQALSSFTVY